MNGVINIYKEKNCTSFHAVAKLRWITGEQKIGHTGTLDPDATGVLPICLGKATKLVDFLMDTDKVYKAELLLGRSTDTLDKSGKVLEEMPYDMLRAKVGSAEAIEKAILSFVGEIEQLPPMYSAVKVDGVKLVDAARKGREIERTPRKVKIYKITDIKVDSRLERATFTVRCSKGTYIRTLCEDIGKALGVPACMGDLERTESSGLGIDTAITLAQAEELAKEGKLDKYIIPTDRFLTKYPPLTVRDWAVRRLAQGNQMNPPDFVKGQKLGEKGKYRIYDEMGNFYALYYYDRKAGCYKCEKMFFGA
ncbi:MAG: tRNA pseudouridine(55) synthase TruB [Lachnospiraceae bacterium]|nr:tRNA pseudouridine(55) synthase TruB [Lachnospiraceae bacterium]